ncbi:MAG TPA: DUF1573 domain-containing protein [Bacteroidia bacterium]|nr:DUF1573 domain-containing protein [Bacteroidia bacterium]
MKKLMLSFTMLMVTIMFAFGQDNTVTNLNPNAPEISFESDVIDYGTIEYSADGNRQFKFKNTGKEPLIITNCQPGCGCTLPNWPKEPIMPGATAVIDVKYATDRVGSFDKTITVTSNAKTASKIIRIKGVVKPNPASQN